MILSFQKQEKNFLAQNKNLERWHVEYLIHVLFFVDLKKIYLIVTK